MYLKIKQTTTATTTNIQTTQLNRTQRIAGTYFKELKNVICIE